MKTKLALLESLLFQKPNTTFKNINLPKTQMDGFIVSAFAIHLRVPASVVVIRLD